MEEEGKTVPRLGDPEVVQFVWSNFDLEGLGGEEGQEDQERPTQPWHLPEIGLFEGRRRG